MQDTEERWTAEQVLALAPDAASGKAGSRLGVPGPWSGTGTDALPDSGGGTVVWGRCAGSGSTPYRTAVDTTGPAFSCTCPSRKVPCKHALGLLLLWSQGPRGPVVTAEQPEWVHEWTGKRRQAALRRETRAASGSPPVADPQAARRRAERRALRVAAGAAELEQRLANALRTGLATAPQDQRAWDEVAARMVDAQAPGLAARARELGALPASGGDWPSRLLEEHGMLHLLARGYLGLERLPDGLAATVRSRVGFTVDAAELLSGPTLRDGWLVLAQQDVVDTALTTRRIWLRGTGSGHTALVLSFGAAGRAPEVSLPIGSVLDAELAWHPGALPLRAALGPRHGPPVPGPVPAGTRVGQALAAYGEALRADPWLEEWPVVLAPVIPVPGPDGWQVADAEGDDALPVDPRRLGRPGLWQLAALSGGHPVTVFGALGPRGVTPLTAWATAAPEAVAL